MAENKEEKIYGLYPAKLHLDILEKCREFEVWTSINDLGGYIWRANHDLADNRPWTRDVNLKELNEMLEEAQYEIEYLVYYTRKYGVTFASEPKAGQHIEHSESYNKWFEFWHNHFNNMSDAQINKMNKAIENNADLTAFLPKTRWNGEPLTTDNGTKPEV